MVTRGQAASHRQATQSYSNSFELLIRSVPTSLLGGSPVAPTRKSRPHRTSEAVKRRTVAAGFVRTVARAC